LNQTSEFTNPIDPVNPTAKQTAKPTVISLFFSDTGGGHRSAVEAIQTAIEQICSERGTEKPVKVVSDNSCEKSHPINRWFVQFYNYLLRHNQPLMKYYYAFVEYVKPDESELGWRLTSPYLEKTIRAFDPDLVVSVHPMCNQHLARCLKETGLGAKAKLVTVVTDPNGDFWSGWACKGSDLTVAPNDLSKKRLMDLGVDESKIVVLGMPVHPDFRNPPTYSKEEFRHNLGLKRDLPTICINAGWAGGGNMMDIYKALRKVVRPVQVIFLCGHNQELYATMKREARLSPIPTAVLPFHDRLADVMASSDLMVTKAGGLTTFEAIARRLPMAIDSITAPMPQELGTTKILVQEGLGQRINTPADIVAIAENMVLREEYAARPLSTAHQLDRVDAVFEIAETILKMAAVEFKSAYIITESADSSCSTAGPVSGATPPLGGFVLDSGDTVASCSSPI
jgi:UDP-N-acetylglucosamine:LPS N-acetylglucosamine transferase